MSSAFPAAPVVPHRHDVGDQHMVVGLGVAGPGRGVAGHGPESARRRRAHLRPAPPPALLLYTSSR